MEKELRGSTREKFENNRIRYIVVNTGAYMYI